MIKKIIFSSFIFSFLFIGCTTSGPANAQTSQDKKMNDFINDLMKKMSLEEKIGQLNLLTQGGGVATGAVVSKDVEAKLKA